MKLLYPLIILSSTLLFSIEWQREFIPDEFGDKTDSQYIYCQVKGTFSNSIENNAPLDVTLVVEKDKVWVKLLHYGKFKPQSPDYKTIEMKPQNVEVVDQQLIDEASKYLNIKRNIGDKEAYEYAQKLIPAT